MMATPITALPQTTAVVVSAAEEKMQEVAHLIQQLDKEEIATGMEHRIYPLTHAEPTKILPILRSMLARLKDVRPDENIDVQADERTRSIIVTAKGTVFEQVEKIIKVLDRKPAFVGADVLIVPLKHADAASLANVLNEMLRPSATGQVTREALALQEQIRLLRVRSTVKDKLPDLDLTKPIKVTADPAKPQGSNSLIITSTPDNLKAGDTPVRNLAGLSDFYVVGQWTAPSTGIVMAALSGRQLIQLLCKRDKRAFVTSA